MSAQQVSAAPSVPPSEPSSSQPSRDLRRAGEAPGSTARVTAVVVAHDRRELLTEALTALAGQTTRPQRVVVVDNASADGSAEAAEAVAAERGLALEVLRLPRNTGGAGGFAAGLAHALHTGDPDLVWLMDDDTVPTPTALEQLLTARARFTAASAAQVPAAESALGGQGGAPALLASRVVWHDGREHPMNTPRRRPGASGRHRLLAATAGAVPVRSASFVSCLVDAGAVRRRGLPLAGYFLWNDDFEFTTRLLRGATGLAVPASVVEHRTRAFGGTDADPGQRFRFEVRNKVWVFTRSASLEPWEKALYGGSTLLRWARTVRGSSARGVLLRAGLAGLFEALRRGPEPTAVALGDLGAVTEAVRAVEQGAGRRAGRGGG